LDTIKKIENIISLIDNSIKEDPDLLLTWWNIIKTWYDKIVDEYRIILENSWEWLATYQSELINQTGISNLKIKFTNVSWYFIEVSKTNLWKIPDDFILKQTLVNSSRFITIKLKEFEQKFLEAQDSLSQREYEIFQEIREKILDWYSYVKNVSKDISYIDFVISLSKVAYNNNYSKPKIHNSYELDIKNARHPVIEQIQSDFISNDLTLKNKDFIHVITWPNMWGKSTYLRQNALIILMAHIWSFIPARQAKIPLTDKIFSRVWASDNLYFGQSTFMVEMQEVANILNNSTKKSFIIIDEVWRWTSTYDGMSLAWAILKNIHDKIKAKTLFATHYHELIDKSKTLSWVKNFSVAVWENDENIVFLRKVIEWWVSKSYWLEVAKLAWINNEILKEAKNMLKLLEYENNKINFYQLSLINSINDNDIKNREDIEEKKCLLEDELKEIDVNNLTPIEALNLIDKLKWKLNESSKNI